MANERERETAVRARVRERMLSVTYYYSDDDDDDAADEIYTFV